MYIICSLFSLVIMLLSATSAPAELSAPEYALGLGLEISSGRFGTGSTSTYVTAPLTLDWFPTDRIDLELTIPFLYQRTENTGRAAVAASAKSTLRGVMTGSGSSATVGGAASGRANEYGLGDITIVGGYNLLQDSDATPRLRPSLYLKFPTADASKGLGTGRFDLGPGLTLSKWWGDLQPFIEGRYIFQGADKDTGAKDYLTAEAGLGYSWNNHLYTSALARFGSNLYDGLAAPLEARLKSVYRFSERSYSEMYFLKGLSDGSPQYGGGLSFFVEF